MLSRHKSLIAVTLVTVASLSVVAAATAVVPGRNGRIAFTSGREAPNDNHAQLYLVDGFGGALSSPFTPVGGQSSHPSWSPDRTKVVFANGTPQQHLT
jgi:Tol biopolymer transport system component